MTVRPRSQRYRPRQYRRLCPAALLVAAFFAAQAGTAVAAADLLARHVPEKPASSELRPGLRDDLLIVKFVEGSQVRLREGRLVSLAAYDLTEANGILTERSELETSRLFSRPPENLERDRERAQELSGREMADLNNYYMVRLNHSTPAAAEALLDELNALATVEIAYAEPIPEPAVLPEAYRNRRPRPAAPAPTAPAGPATATPDFQPLQGYLDPAPTGIDAYAGWTYPGGRGESVRLIDIEIGWNWSHEDMMSPFFEGGVVTYGDHGVAVMGEIAAVDNGYGVTGIANALDVGCHSVLEVPTADVFDQVVSLLDPGDIFVIELHCPGPAAWQGGDQYGFIALEWWQANYDVIATATANGIICCEAAGNGEQDLDDPIYEGRFDRNVRDSGAIIVGATDGADLYPAWFTNYGSRVDLSGWGYDVVTCGYGDLQAGPRDEWYTSGFGGTSSATPIVTGAVAVMQGIYKAQSGGIPLSGSAIAQILKETGTPQIGTDHIGPRPDLAAAVPVMLNDLATVEGTVTEAGGGEGIEGVDLRLVETGARTSTAADGSYSLLATAGTWTLRAEKFGFGANNSQVETAPGETTIHDIALPRLGTARIRGVVVDDLHQGIAGATVTLPGTPLAPVMTQSGGSYEVPGVPFGFRGIVLATAAGFTPDAHMVDLAGAPPRVNFRLVPPEDFESGDGGLTGTGEWEWGIPSFAEGPEAHSGLRCWGTDLVGDYDFGAVHRLTTPDYDLAGMEDPRLSFWHWHSIWGPYDGANVNISTDGGANWQVIEPVGGYTDPCIDGLPGTPCQPGWTGPTEGWVPGVFDLRAYEGETARFRFTLGPWGYTDAPGWYIDDLQVYSGAVRTTVEWLPERQAYLGEPMPSPTRAGVSLELQLPAPAEVEVRVFSVTGRQVRLLKKGLLPAGPHLIHWDARDEGGERVVPGVYFVRFSADDIAAARKLLVLR